jgi:hypothetical protein
MLKATLLRAVAISLLLGGSIRLFASRTLFETFGIGDIWMGTPYSVYTYRTLAGFVILSGILLMMMAAAPAKYRDLLRVMAGGFAVIGLVMVIAGLTVGLPARYYLPDPLYCFIVAVLLWRSAR